MQSSEVTELLDQLYLGKTMPSQQTQSGHSRLTEDQVYGISATENPFTTFTQQRQFKKLSQIWHQFLQFPSASGYSTKATSELEKMQEKHTAARWHRLGQVNLHTELQKMIHSDAQFRGIQLPALQSIMARQSRVMLVMRTGGGKSLMYMLPAVCSPEGLTVVVVPLCSLQSDQARRCQMAGLRVALWGSSKAIRVAQIVLVTPESAVTKAFGRFLMEKASAGFLDQVVIDECHSILDAASGWRPKLLQLSKLVEKQCQLIYLTATLPPTEERAFFYSSGLDPKEVLLLREPTTRFNVAYKVIEYAASKQDQAVQDIVSARLAQIPSSG
jgi:superfamily II DNA helicase RecQ